MIAVMDKIFDQGVRMNINQGRYILAFLLAGSILAHAEGVDTHAADRQQLLSIMAESERGINEQNIDLLATHVDESARITWLNNEVSVGPEGVRQYFKRMVGSGADAVLSRYTTHASVTDHARFYGDVAVANGTMEDEFTPHARGVFKFHSNWAATFVKKGDQWKIVSLNFSTNTFNNSLIDELRQKIWMFSIAGALAGLLLAFGVLRFRKKTK
jgi:hypothetical protein